MKLLFISTWFPYPPDTGSRIRVYHLLQALARRYSVDLVTFMPDAQGDAFLPELRRWCAQVEVVRRSPFWRDPRLRLVGHLSRLPRDVIAGHSPELAAAVDRFAAAQAYDAVIASVTTVAPYALQVRGVPRILEAHNFLTGWMKERYQSKTSLTGRAAGWITWLKCQRYERWLFPQFQMISMVSERDRAAVEAAILGCKGRVRVSPNGIDVERNRPGLVQPVENALVFNGALSYYANLDAMRFFLAEIFPRITAQQPQARLKITGRAAGLDLSQLPLNEHVTLTGFLDDVRPTVAGSWACIVPLRIGGGTRLKILEAMALGTPVISTTKGAEGLDLRIGEDILVADDPETFARQTLRLLRDPELHARLARNGRALVEAKYSWADISRSFCQMVEEVAGESQPKLWRAADAV